MLMLLLGGRVSPHPHLHLPTSELLSLHRTLQVVGWELALWSLECLVLLLFKFQYPFKKKKNLCLTFLFFSIVLSWNPPLPPVAFRPGSES